MIPTHAPGGARGPALAGLARAPRTGADPVTGADSRRAPMLSDLVMVGASVKGVLGRGGGPEISYCTPGEFRGVKRPHAGAMELLRAARGGARLADGWLWNTCSRFELYGWFDGAPDQERAESLVLGAGAGPVNRLRGREALRHALRTAAGLNSPLAGDAEVVDQLRSCVRASEHAGGAGDGARWLSEELAASAERVRAETAWGRFAHRYCRVVIERLRDRLPAGRGWTAAVIGGSTTSASVLETLTGTLGLAPARVALACRAGRSGALSKRLAAGARGGRVLRVERYDDPAVLGAIGGADAVFLAADQREAILSGAQLAGSRDLSARGMVVVDFNTFGSLSAGPAVPGLRVFGAAELEAEVAAFNGEVIGAPGFAGAWSEAEHWIARRVSELLGEGTR
jgi:glutamyl-tRNA reductase